MTINNRYLPGIDDCLTDWVEPPCFWRMIFDQVTISSTSERRMCKRQHLGRDMAIMSFLSCPLAWLMANVHESHELSIRAISRSICDYFDWRHSDLLKVWGGSWDALLDSHADSSWALVVCQAIQVCILAIWASNPWPHSVIGKHISASSQGWSRSQMGEIEVVIRDSEFLGSCRIPPMVHTGFLFNSSSSQTAD